MNLFVTAIGTDSGKTIVSSIFCEAFQCDYWKPIQAGLPRDSDTIRELITNKKTQIHPERYLLQTPASPHAAAKIDGVQLSVSDFTLPVSSRSIIVEGAGGLLVPINDQEFVIDIITHLQVDVILVCNLYLGSINHSLLSFEAIKRRNIKVKAIIFNGEPNAESERIITLHAGIPSLIHIQQEKKIDRETISKYAAQLKNQWK
jgi:dethiobiotin synthetase